MSAVTAIAHPRVGLLGNPSDLYRGRVLGFAFDDFAARATIEPAPASELVAPDGARVPVGAPQRLRARELDARP